MDPLRYTIAGMPASGAKDDGTVEMRFSTVEGQPLWLTFPVEQIDRFAVRAHQASVMARIQKAATSGHLEFHGEAVATVAAEPAVGGSAVQLIVRTHGRETIPYSLSLSIAKELLSELTAAIAAATDDAGQTRQ